MRIYQGYTLLELMITVAIAGILLAIVVPNFMNLMERNSVSATSNEILSALLFARSEAVRIEDAVTFTPEGNGWLVTNANNVNIVDQTVDNENITLSENIQLDSVTYNARGRADTTEGDGIDISFDGTVQGRICVSLTGRPYIKSVDEGNCP